MNRGWFIFGIAFTITTLWISGLWSFTWGETNAENAADVILVDNHLLISGSQKSAETIEDDILLLNLSLSGTTEWARHTQVNLWDRANSVIPLSGGGFAYAGYCGAASSTWDYILGKADATGNTLWVHNYGAGNKHERAYALAETMNGSLIVIGNNDTDYQGWMLITDADGTQTGSQTFSYTTETYAWDIITTPVGHHLVVGTQKGSNADVMLVMLNITGTEIWHQNLGGTPNHYGYCGNNTTDGFIIGGSHKVSGLEYNLMLMKANEAGEMQWVQTYDLDDYEQFNEVVQTPDGGFLAVGSTGSYSTKDWCILKTDANGNELWHRRIGGTANDECNALSLLPNGNIVAVGITESVGAGSYDIWINFFNADGTATEDTLLPSPPSPRVTCTPNPFKASCGISLKDAGSGPVNAAIYNIRGQKVYSLPALNKETFTWNGCNDQGRALPSGVYYARLSKGATTKVAKLVLMK